MTTAISIRVTGRVQGVGYRASTAQEADRLGITGWVRNELDGSVSAHLEGSEEAVSTLLAWCRHGPRGAVVGDVGVDPAEPSGSGRFEIIH